MSRKRKEYPQNFKTIYGITTMGFLQTVANSLMSSALMLYITDYSGIYAGQVGKAAAVATLLLLVGRLWDAVNDPILGVVMDKTPRSAIGKFKPFMLGGTFLSAILIVFLFNIPSGLSDFSKVIWLYVIYILFESAFTLIPLLPFTVSLSKDQNVRTKLLVAPRIANMIIAIPISFFFAIAALIGKEDAPNIGLAVILFVVPTAVVSLLGIALVKEGKSNADEGSATFKDFLMIFKKNKPLLFSQLAGLFAGFTFSFLMAAITYYIKYAFGAENFASQSAIWGMIMLFGIIIGTIIAQFAFKKVTAGQGYIISYIITIVPLAVLWIISIGGPIKNPVILYPLLFASILGNGMSYIPGSLLNMECMDYNKYVMGKSLEGVTYAVSQFNLKLQAAIGSTVTGAVLIAVGYDAELYKNTTQIPNSLFNGLSLIIFGLPVICGIIAIAIMWFYPLRKKADYDNMMSKINLSK